MSQPFERIAYNMQMAYCHYIVIGVYLLFVCISVFLTVCDIYKIVIIYTGKGTGYIGIHNTLKITMHLFEQRFQ